VAHAFDLEINKLELLLTRANLVPMRQKFEVISGNVILLLLRRPLNKRAEASSGLFKNPLIVSLISISENR
jgi:hypothetical protein